MTIKYGKFQLPTSIKADGKNRFVAEPFEKGFAHTVGNAIRRVTLTSIEAPAIISIMIEGISHEYMAEKGILEDMTHVVLNFKGSKLRRLPLSDKSPRGPFVHSKEIEITPEMIEKGGGQHVLTLGELMEGGEFDVVNPEHPIFTATIPMKKRIDLKIAIGRGYVPAERQNFDKVAGEIVIDAIFSPVKVVNYYVENTRVGQDTDYDRLVLEITTDGRITPQEALTFATQIGIIHFECFNALNIQPISFDHDDGEVDTDRDQLLSKLRLKINEIELSVRSTNCLSQANIETIVQLVLMTEPELLKFRNFGKKSLNEIKAKLEEMGLHLGMNLSPYGITKENSDEFLASHKSEDTETGKEGI